MSSKLFRNTFLYVFAGFLPVAANFFLAPLYTQFLPPQEYALVGMATLFQAFLTFFFSISLDSAFSRMFFNYERWPRIRHGLLSTLLIVVTLCSVFVFLLLCASGDRLFRFFFSNPSFKFTDFGVWVVITTYCNVIYLFFAIYYRNSEKVKNFLSLNLLFFFVPVAGTLTGLIFFEKAALSSVIGRAIGCMAVVLPVLFYFFFRNGVKLVRRFIVPSFRYSLPVMIYQLMFAGFLYLDRFFLLHYFTIHDFGVYNFAALVSGVVPVFLSAVTNATNPAIYRELTTRHDPEKVQRYNYIILFVSMLFVCICVAVIVPAMQLLINSEYASSYPYAGLLFLSYLLYVHYLVFALPLFYHGKTSAFPKIAFLSLIAGIVFNLLFIPKIGLWSVCLSLFCIRGTQMSIAFLFTRKFGYHKLNYVKQKKFQFTSVLILGCYALIFLANQQYHFMAISVVNLLPVTLFFLVMPVIYKKELKAIQLLCLGILKSKRLKFGKN